MCEFFCAIFSGNENLRNNSPKFRHIFRRSFEIDRPLWDTTDVRRRAQKYPCGVFLHCKVMFREEQTRFFLNHAFA